MDEEQTQKPRYLGNALGFLIVYRCRSTLLGATRESSMALKIIRVKAFRVLMGLTDVEFLGSAIIRQGRRSGRNGHEGWERVKLMMRVSEEDILNLSSCLNQNGRQPEGSGNC